MGHYGIFDKVGQDRPPGFFGLSASRIFTQRLNLGLNLGALAIFENPLVTSESRER